MKEVETIKALLTAELEGCKALVELLRKEKEYLLNLDVQGIEQVSKEKDSLLLQLRLYDEERERVMARMKKEGKGFNTIKDLCEFTADEELKGLRSKLRSLLQSLKELNEVNRLLIDRSIEHLHQGIEFCKTLGFDPSSKLRVVQREA